MNIIQPAHRLENANEYYFSTKGKEIARLNAEGKDIISLAIGSPDLPPSEETIATLCREAQRLDAHGYQPTAGILPLREAMADFYQRWYHVTLDPHTEIQPLIGSKEGILHTTLAFVNPGDEVLVPDPGYPTYTALSNLLGAKVIKYDLSPENEWQPNFELLEQRDWSKTKLFWVNYPHMPTGAMAQRNTFERLVDLAQRKGFVVINDNPYSFILSKERLSILQIPGAKECCIEFNSMSKSHNMPGWRIGMLAGNAQFISWILKVKSNIDSGTFRPLQLAAAQALNNTDEWHEEFNNTVYTRRRILAGKIMTTIGCNFDQNTVGLFLWGRIPSRYATAEVLTERLLHEAHVFLTPGFIFGKNGEQYVRISLCATEERLQEALERIQRIAHTL